MKIGLAILIIIGAAFGALLSCSRAPSRAEVVKAYEAAVNAADIDSMLSLVTDNTIVEVVGMAGAIEGHERIRAKAEYDSALQSNLAITILETRKDTVFCHAMEANAWTREAGLPPNEYTSYAFTIRVGKITEIRAELSESTIARVNEIMARLIPWAQENQPQALDSLMAGDEFTFSAKSAHMMMALLQDWRARGGN